MRCAWKELLAILPLWLREDVDRHGRESLRELRLRLNAPPELVVSGGSRWLSRCVTRDDLRQCVNNASRYSPWNAVTMEEGYLTAPGGHRIGLCGEAVSRNGAMAGLREVTSLCIRVARDFPGIASDIAMLGGSVLIAGAPGWGKTTLLRDLIRQRSDLGEHICVVDERGELFPQGGCFSQGKCADILTGCSKSQGVEMLLRTMGPDSIAVDEITARQDSQALLHATHCGVKLLATAHAGSLQDLKNREVYRQLLDAGLFHHILLMKPDKSWTLERTGI